MDVELQILKHLKRDAQPTVAIIDQYCKKNETIRPLAKVNFIGEINQQNTSINQN